MSFLKRIGRFIHGAGILLILLFPRGAAEGVLLDRALAIVNGKVISLTDVEVELTFFNPETDILAHAKQREKIPDAWIESGIEDLINHQLLLAEAQRFDVETVPEDLLQKKLDEIRKRFPSAADFQKALEFNAITLNDLEQKIREHLIVQQFIDQRIRFFVIVLPDDISNYYSENREQFRDIPMEQAEREIEKTLVERKSQERLGSYLSKLRTKANIQHNF